MIISRVSFAVPCIIYKKVKIIMTHFFIKSIDLNIRKECLAE